MLNKELLMGVEKPFTPITIRGKVTKSGTKVGIGWCTSNYPNFVNTPINAIPLYSTSSPYKWNFALYYETRNRFHSIVLPYAGYVGIPEITVTVDGKAYTVGNQFDDEYTSGITDIDWKLDSKIGQYIEVELDPPPSGTWIQRHSNRSRKRVLCRRSSLGGSK